MSRSNISLIGPSEILHEIKSRLRDGFSIKVAVAFLGIGGLVSLSSALKRATGKFVVGTSRFYITDWKALSQLHSLAGKNPNLGVRMNSNTGFHPKVFYFEKGRSAAAVLGSSNLTGGGFGANTEANVLVRGSVNDQFLKEVRQFVNATYAQADPLDRDFIADYQQRARRIRERFDRYSEGKRRQTPLPNFELGVERRPVQLPKSEKFWKVAPGFDAEDWQRWENSIDSQDNGIIAIGWSSVGSLRSQLRLNRDDFNRTVAQLIHRARYDSYPAYAARQLWAFGKEIKEHDLVVAYSARTIFGIAKVTGSYYYDNDSPGYCHTRSVHWLSLDRLRPPKNVMRKLATNDTVRRIQDPMLLHYLKSTVLNVKAS